LDVWDRTKTHLAENSVADYQVQMGPALAVDPATELFAGANAPNEWLSRDYRSPYSLPTAEAV
jgi:hypothetical protein